MENEGRNKKIALTRIFDAPRELVWRACTDPVGISNWWGPNGFTTTTESMDLRPGGEWKHTMHGPDGVDYPNLTEYIEVDPPNRLVYRNSGGKSETTAASFISTVDFRESGDGTEVSVRMEFATADMRDMVEREYGAIEGLENTFSRLAEYLGRN